jgi:hypothetical protein
LSENMGYKFKNNNNIMYKFVFFFTFLVFFIELVYLNSPKVGLNDYLIVFNLFLLLYLVRRDYPWIKSHHKVIETLGLMMIITLLVRISII